MWCPMHRYIPYFFHFCQIPHLYLSFDVVFSCTSAHLFVLLPSSLNQPASIPLWFNLDVSVSHSRFLTRTSIALRETCSVFYVHPYTLIHTVMQKPLSLFFLLPFYDCFPFSLEPSFFLSVSHSLLGVILVALQAISLLVLLFFAKY